MRKDKLATTNPGNQEGRAPPPPPITTHEDHIPRPSLERRLQGGPRHQDASAIRPKADFRREEGRRGGPGSLTHSQEEERHRSAAGIEVDVKSTRCFPHSKTSTTPSSTARSDRPTTRSARGDRHEGKGPGGRRSHLSLQRDLVALTPPKRAEGKAISTQGRYPGFQSHSHWREAADPCRTGRRAVAGRLLGWRRGGGRKERWWMLGFGSLLCRPRRATREPRRILVHPL